ncbi:hypothetical protein ACFV0D_41230, partial [Streptomyces sp. NPDC059556]
MPPKDFRVFQRRRRRPWGVLTLAMLSGIAMMRNGVDLAEGGAPPPAGGRPGAGPAGRPRGGGGAGG